MHLLIVYYSAKKTVKRQKLGEVLTSLWLEVWETYGIDGL